MKPLIVESGTARLRPNFEKIIRRMRPIGPIPATRAFRASNPKGSK